MRVDADTNIHTPVDEEEEPRRLLSLETSARVLGDITVREVYKRIDAGDLESVWIGRRRMVTAASLDAYVERLRQEAEERKAAGA